MNSYLLLSILLYQIANASFDIGHVRKSSTTLAAKSTSNSLDTQGTTSLAKRGNCIGKMCSSPTGQGTSRRPGRAVIPPLPQAGHQPQADHQRQAEQQPQPQESPAKPPRYFNPPQRNPNQPPAAARWRENRSPSQIKADDMARFQAQALKEEETDRSGMKQRIEADRQYSYKYLPNGQPRPSPVAGPVSQAALNHGHEVAALTMQAQRKVVQDLKRQKFAASYKEAKFANRAHLQYYKMSEAAAFGDPDSAIKSHMVLGHWNAALAQNFALENGDTGRQLSEERKPAQAMSDAGIVAKY